MCFRRRRDGGSGRPARQVEAITTGGKGVDRYDLLYRRRQPGGSRLPLRAPAPGLERSSTRTDRRGGAALGYRQPVRIEADPQRIARGAMLSGEVAKR